MNALYVKNTAILSVLMTVCGLAAAELFPNAPQHFTPEQVRAQLERTMKNKNKQLLLPGQSATTDHRPIICVSGNLGQIRVYQNPIAGIKVTCLKEGKILIDGKPATK